jgi:hypothetical protein
MTIPAFEKIRSNTKPSPLLKLCNIEDHYTFEPTALKTAQHNAAGENSGSCKLFSFGTAGTNSEGTLACFGAYYFEDVIGNQMGLIIKTFAIS